MIYFKNVEFLSLFILLLPLIYLLKVKKGVVYSLFKKEVFEKIELKNRTLSKKTRNILLLISFSFIIIAIARPVIDNGEIKVKSSFINIVTAIDISKSMMSDDIYPNRFEFAKNKFFAFLDNVKNMRVALIGFTSQTFLISPLTEDFNSLKFLTKNLRFDYLNLKGTNILSTLETANNLFKDEKKKILLLFTDGGDQKSFKEEIAYAKTHNITVYVYNIGTEKGGIIKDKSGVLKDKNGNIVVVKLNEDIKELALKTGGAYMKYSLNKNDVKLLAQAIKERFKAKDEKESTIRDEKELFYYPLLLAIILFLISISSLPARRKV